MRSIQKMRNIQNFVQIKKGFSERYYINEQGLVYDAISDRIKKPYSDNCFKLKKEDNTYKTISQRSLFESVFNKPFIKDQIRSLQNELWKQIDGSRIFVSNFGRIKSYEKLNAVLLNPYESRKNNGYLRVKISINGTLQNKYIHCLVADAFVQKPDDYDISFQVHHIDFNRFNNNAQNLIWLSKQKHRQIHKQKKSIQ